MYMQRAAQARLSLGRALHPGRGVLRVPVARMTGRHRWPAVLAAALRPAAGSAAAAQQPSAPGTSAFRSTARPGRLDAITDVPGVTVGHATIVRGTGKLRRGQGTGAHRGDRHLPARHAPTWHPVFAGWFSLNGNGEMTGTPGSRTTACWSTRSPSPTPTASARCATPSSGGARTRLPDALDLLPAGRGRDLGRRPQRHLRLPRHQGACVPRAGRGHRRPVPEGNVGGGTGMICLGFKGGIGTASRRLSDRRWAASRWACWCSATSACGASSGSRACR